MKSFKTISIVLWGVLALPAQTLAQSSEARGGLDGSGGNGPRIDPKVVDKVVELLPEYLPFLARRIGFIFWLSGGDFAGGYAAGVKESLPVLEAWYKSDRTSPLLDELASGKLRYVSRNTCPSKAGHSGDASYSKDTLCFNRKNLSQNSAMGMVAHLTYLAFHELAHHFGFSEDLAQAVQRELQAAHDIIDPSWQQVMNDIAAMETLDKSIAEVKEGLKAHSDLPVCHGLGTLASSLNSFVESHLLREALEDPGMALVDQMDGINGFCGVSQEFVEYPVVPIGDRAELQVHMTRIEAQLAELMRNLRLYLAAQITSDKLGGAGDFFSLVLFLQEHGIFVMDPG